MAYSHSPRTVTDGLVFYYDLANQLKSYKGEPTTNLITDTSDFGSTFWNQKSGTFTANDIVGPRGIQNAAKIVAVNTDPYIYSSAVVTVTAGSVTWSIWVKGTGDTVGKSAEARINFSGTASGTDNNISITLTNQWQLLQVSATVTGGGTIKFGLEAPNGAISGDIMYFADPMFEQKSHATQFTAGTRSATQGLIDLIGNSTIDLSNVSFDSTAQMTFDGTGDYITIPHNAAHSFTGDFSIEVVFKPTGNTANCLIQKGSGNDYYQEYWILCDTRNTNRTFELIMGQTGNSSANYTVYAGNVVTIGEYHHVVAVVQGTTGYLYVNGALVDTGEISNRIQSTSDIRIGERVDGFADSLGYQPLTKLYSKALSASEVAQNFNAVRVRYAI